MKRHWYEIFITECPPCGRTWEHRVRRYSRKPKDPRKRFHIEYHCCSACF